MDKLNLKQLRQLFGNMPVGNLPAAQIMEQNSKRNKVLIAVAIGSMLFGAVAAGWWVAQNFKKQFGKK